MISWSRRSLLKFASVAIPSEIASARNLFAQVQPAPASVPAPMVTDIFPSHPRELVREMVIVSHFNEKRVRELAEARPALAKAAYDWGFGDWETAIGAASHMGNRAIAEYLISKGARPSLFSAAMLGQLDVVKAFIAAEPGAHRIRGPHSISLIAHARLGGAAARPVLEFLQTLEDAEDRPVPLAPEEISMLTGTYIFGGSGGQVVDVDAEMMMYVNSKMYSHPPQLNWTRKGTMTRPLFHLGDRTFYPAGAQAVRIRFREEATAVVMTVSDPDVVLTATRKKP
jgi:hypothetical protein